jgi:hypothetical protein
MVNCLLEGGNLVVCEIKTQLPVSLIVRAALKVALATAGKTF